MSPSRSGTSDRGSRGTSEQVGSTKKPRPSQSAKQPSRSGAKPRARSGAKQPARSGAKPQTRTAKPQPARKTAKAKAPRRIGNPDGRMKLISAACLLLLVIFAGRLVYIQGMDTMQLAEKALQQRLRTEVLPAQRGSVYAADGSVLAGSVPRFRLIADPQNIAQYKDEEGELLGVQGAAEDLAGVLEVSPDTIRPKLEGDRRYSKVTDGLTAQVWNEIKALAIPGISKEEYAVRTYPNGAVAGNLLGFVSSDGTPLAGLEVAYDEMLTGRDGERQYERSVSGESIPLGEKNTQPAVDGTSVELTINPEIQHYAQRQIAAQVREHDAEWGTVIVQDIATGELLGLAESPMVDPNNPGAATVDARNAEIFESSFEPGSTAKAMTAAALIEEGKVGPESEFTVPDKWEAPNGEVFRDSSPHEDQKMTFAGILADSSNTGTVMAGQKLDSQTIYDYFTDFGFGQTSGIGFPGESAGIFHQPEDWDGRTKYAVMFGQGMAGTSLQSASAFATIANGGVKMPQRLVKATVDGSGQREEIPVSTGDRVVSESTSKQLRSMLEGVITDGTGQQSAVPGYRVGGKTGTAQAPAANGGGYDGYTASFIGIAPIEDPRIVVSVVLQRPRNGYYGGTAAGPVFQEVTAFALRSLGVPPSTEEPELYPREWED